MRTRSLTPIISLAVALGAVGCGSSSSNSSSSSPSTSTTQTAQSAADAYRSTINAACAANNAEINAMPANTENSVAGLKKLEGTALATLARIKAVTPPDSIAAPVKLWLGQVEAQTAMVKTIIGDIQSGDTAHARALSVQAAALTRRLNQTAAGIGLSSCAQDTQPQG